MMLQKKKRKEIHKELAATLDDNALSYATIKNWAVLFKAGRESVDDDSRSGCPTSAVTDESVKDVEKFVVKDRRVSVRQIASEMGISVGSVETILHDRLNLFKASVRWFYVCSLLSRKSCASRFRNKSEGSLKQTLRIFLSDLSVRIKLESITLITKTRLNYVNETIQTH